MINSIVVPLQMHKEENLEDVDAINYFNRYTIDY